MASIKGFQLKGVVNFRGHEGELLSQGNIYYKNKKVGFYGDANKGIPQAIELTGAEVIQAYEKASKEYCEFPDLFFSELLDLSADEKEYKKFVKKGYPITFSYVKNTVQRFVGHCMKESQLDSLKADKSISNLRIYRKPEDFIIE